MSKLITRYGLIVIFVLSSSALTQAASPRTYQVTGPVLEVTNDLIVVQKGKERWEVARDGNTKVTGDIKVGAKVTVMYTMTATAVEAKGEKPAK
ncbi:MAG TPA: hypothetical protein VGI60_14895 [Chthoniobacterales bacterium]|jgi:hypothetical protein